MAATYNSRHQRYGLGGFVANGALTDNAVTAAGIDVSTRAFANSAITNIDTAISTASPKEPNSEHPEQIRAYHQYLGNHFENLSA